MSKRTEQMNELFRRAAGEFILTEIELPENVIVTVTKVSVSNDSKNVRIFVSIFPENRRGSSMDILNDNRHNLKEYLADKLSLRIIPGINYYVDASENKIDEVERLLREIEREKY
ncbi:MAG: ribosome-binding factor A [bacterium]